MQISFICGLAYYKRKNYFISCRTFGGIILKVIGGNFYYTVRGWIKYSDTQIVYKAE